MPGIKAAEHTLQGTPRLVHVRVRDHHQKTLYE